MDIRKIYKFKKLIGGGNFGTVRLAHSISDPKNLYAVKSILRSNIKKDVKPLEEELEITEAEYQGKKVKLNDPIRGGNKKFYVYVKNDKGNVIKVSFGDTTGLSIKRDDPERRKSFRARHNCDTAKDKTTARYWSCRMWTARTKVSDLD